MPFKKGDPKPPKSGMKKGQKTKKTVWLRDALLNVGLIWEQELLNAYKENDYKKIELLQQLIPYLNPKIKDQEFQPESSEPESEKTDAELISIIK